MDRRLDLGLTSRCLALACFTTTIFAAQVGAMSIDTFAGRGVGDRRKAVKASVFTPTGIAILGDRTLIADSGHARIRMVKPNGRIFTYAGTYPGTFGDFGKRQEAGLKRPLKARVAPNGDVIIAEYGAHRVRRISNGTVFTVAGLPDDAGFSGDGGQAASARLDSPADAFMDAAGDIYIADSGNNRIRKVDGTTGVISTVAGTGQAGNSGNNGPAVAAELDNPVCVVPAPGGGYFVCDFGNHTIRKVDAAGTITRIAGRGEPGFSGDGRRARKARLNSPTDVAIDAKGNMLVADSGNQRVRHVKLIKPNPRIKTVAGDGTEGYTGSGVPALSPLGDPTGVEVHPDGSILIAEASNHRVRALQGGVLTDFAGDGITTFGGDGGPMNAATFEQIHGTTVDLQGNVIVGDSGNNRIRKIDVATGLVSTIAGTGDPGFSGDGGPATSAGLSVSDLVVDAAGGIIFSDTKNDRVRRIDPSGTVTTIAGTGTDGFSGDGGPATSAELSSPTGLELDAAGNLYIADFLNNRIRMVDAVTQTISTIAGDGAAGFDGDGQQATAASLNNPTDVAIDGFGHVYIADFRNHCVRRVDAVSGEISTFAGTGVAGDSSDGPLVPTMMQLREPSDVAFDSAGDLLIADSGNDKIRRIALSGDGGMRTIAGTGAPGLKDKDNARKGKMAVPLRLHPIAGDSFLIADSFNFVIRILEP